MGGALLKSWNLPEKRISSKEYHSLITEIKPVITNLILSLSPKSSLKIGVAPTFRLKESHGDLDILIWCSNHIPSNQLKQAFSTLSGFPPNLNDNTYSFPYKGFQIDLKFCKRKYFRSSLNYSSWGDCGNLVGRIAHKMGLSYGHDGLSYFLREREFDGRPENDHVVEKICLTTETSEIFELLGLDYDRWFDGFDTEEDMWAWLVNSKYFNPEIYDWDNLNHQNRTRNRKRPGYCRFLEFVNKNKEKLNCFIFDSKENYLVKWKSVFEFLEPRIEHLRKIWAENQNIKAKFNGKLVMDWLNLENGSPDLGKIIAKFKFEHNRNYFVNNSCEQIKADFLMSLKKPENSP